MALWEADSRHARELSVLFFTCEPILNLQLDLWSELCESDTLFTKNSGFIAVKRKVFFLQPGHRAEG